MRTGTIGVCLLAALLAGGAGMTGIAAAGPLGDDVPEARPLRTLLSGQFGRLLALRSELDVSAEQRTEIRDIVKGHKQELAAALQPVAEKRRALRDATLAEHGLRAEVTGGYGSVESVFVAYSFLYVFPLGLIVGQLAAILAHRRAARRRAAAV